MILVSIVGDFFSSVIPVYYNYKDQITRHIILYDDYKNDVIIANKFIQGSQLFNEQYQLEIETIAYKINEDSTLAIQNTIAKIDSIAHSKEDLFINITDGLSNVIVLIAQHYFDTDATLITYDRFDNEVNKIKRGTMTNFKLPKSVPIKDHFLLKAIKVVNYSNKSLADLHEDFLTHLFTNLNGEIEKIKNLPKEFANTSIGTLFEYHVYNLIKRLNYDDILIGVEVNDYYTNDEFLTNEFDILVMKENHLHMIECKYQDKIASIQYIYKVISLAKVIDHDGKSIIVTNSAKYNISDSLNHNISTPYKRAKNNNIILRGSPIKNKRAFVQDVDKFFALQTENNGELSSPYQEINSYLHEVFDFDINIFDIHTSSKILNYNTAYPKNHRVQQAMQTKEINQLIKKIHRLNLETTKHQSLEVIYEFYLNQIKLKGEK